MEQEHRGRLVHRLVSFFARTELSCCNTPFVEGRDSWLITR
ncbi:hypothetical protein THTE_0687 [Thermogutta terrifontis]|uniref:Uncharacterized protein n=1 Tax=Thermogutta terrifontis TaxID=1331910 RepID=A0A286RBH6_9BACT|nr:hypothetical protein THTE_0687 [Thermogutta terrifontis]